MVRTLAAWLFLVNMTLLFGGCGGALGGSRDDTASSRQTAVTGRPWPLVACSSRGACSDNSSPKTVAGRGGESRSGANPFQLPYMFYKRVVSATDGPRCGHYPTCSMYAVQAMEHWGILLGSLLALDRVLSPAGISSAVRAQPVVFFHGVPRHYDPLDANDFWIDPAPPGRAAP